MKVRCPHCQVIYDIPSAILKRTGGKAICSECHNMFRAVPKWKIQSGNDDKRPAPKPPAPRTGQEQKPARPASVQESLPFPDSGSKRASTARETSTVPATPRQPSRATAKAPRPEGTDARTGAKPSRPERTSRRTETKPPQRPDSRAAVEAVQFAKADKLALPDALPDTQPLEDTRATAPSHEDAPPAEHPSEAPSSLFDDDPFISDLPPPHQKKLDARKVLSLGLLTLLAGIQLAWLQKDALLQQPWLRPVAEKICPYFDCQLPETDHGQAYHILDRLFEPAASHPGAYRLSLLLRNDSGKTQPPPALQLSLLDRAQQVMARRTFSPADYARGQSPSIAPLKPGSTLEVHLLLIPPLPDIAGFELELHPSRS